MHNLLVLYKFKIVILFYLFDIEGEIIILNLHNKTIIVMLY